MSKINLHEMFEARMNEQSEPYTFAADEFKMGYTAALSDLQAKVDGLLEALKFYSKIKNFEKVVWEDDDKSGPCEPFDFDENELVERYADGCLGDFGLKAEQALAEFKKGFGE
jgi:hypothetical protein